jgi:tetratricopeptide (TPR) repeat protein
MHSARIAAWVLGAAVLAAAPARAQETSLDPLRAAAKASPGDARAALELGRALRRAGRENEALVELRRGVNLTRGAGDVALDLHWEIARTHISKRDFPPASVQCKVLGALPGGAQSGRVCQAEALLLWRRATEAMPEVQAALKLGKSYEAKVAEGIAWELQLKESDAEASFREALAMKPDRVEAHLALGKMLAKAGKPEGVAELKKALEIDPKNPDALYEMGMAAATQADQTAHLEKAIKERPSHVGATKRLAELLLAQNKVADARKMAEAALRSDGTDAAVHVVLGRVTLAENKPDEAIKIGNTALGYLSNSSGAKLLIADAYAKKGEIDLAVENYQAAWGFDHGDPAPLVSAAVACRAAGRATSARAFGQKATREFPTWGPGWVALGDAYAADKDAALAKQAYETALKSKGPVDAADVQRKISALK